MAESQSADEAKVCSAQLGVRRTSSAYTYASSDVNVSADFGRHEQADLVELPTIHPQVQSNKLRDLEGLLDRAISKLNACNERNDKYHDAINKQRKERLGLDHVSARLPEKHKKVNV